MPASSSDTLRLSLGDVLEAERARLATTFVNSLGPRGAIVPTLLLLLIAGLASIPLPEGLPRAVQALAEGTIRLEIGGRYPLDDAVAAYQALEGRASTGKLLLLP